MNKRYNEQDPAPQYDPETARIRRALRAQKARRRKKMRSRRLFLLGMALILLFAALIVQGIFIALNAPDFFGTMLGIGITAQVAWQAFCHIGVATAFLPNTGISLP